MKLYENVIIGNFLYGLGLDIGIKIGLDDGTETLPSIINLLQQTPADKELGDMLLEFPGVVRVLEFKNAKNPSNKEKKRVEKLEKALKDNERMQYVSRQMHWYIETEPFEEICVNKIVPYLDVYNGTMGMETLESFIKSISIEVNNPISGITHEEQKHYLSLISTCQGSGAIGTGGLIVSVSKEGINYVEFSQIEQLQLQHEDFKKEIQQKCESIMQSEYELEQKLEQNRLKSRSYGLERSM
ncbi:hypothetical protein Q6A89_06785 [Aliarcobacter skirrowii]|uniref:hypothetical protein n=1 Tax=Aliarcobacter skirrowii TaxID=28200 RepID=UPI0029B280E0|nr:hypothetical protein [Aliarcobacter skirrowii]MDX4060217.1 hypothetical protein [Aliarcobacter skirrowii]